MKRDRGFTWIELLTAIVVIGILAMMAIPSLQDTTLRKQVKDALDITALARSGVQAAYAVKGEMPADNKAAGIPDAQKMVGNLVREVKVDQGAITITFGNNASNALKDKHVTLLPAVVPDEQRVPIAWLCNAAAVPQGMQVRGRNETDVPAKWLPVECRGAAPK